MKTTFESLSHGQQRIMEDAWDMYNHKWNGHMLPIGEHMESLGNSTYDKLVDKGLLRQILIMAGWKYNEYGYVITPAGIELMRETKYVQTRTHRAELMRQFREGEITEAQLLDGLEHDAP